MIVTSEGYEKTIVRSEGYQAEMIVASEGYQAEMIATSEGY